MAAVITALTPTRIREGVVLVIDGTGFAAANNAVLVGGQAASISAQSSTQITVTVPAGLSPGVNFQTAVQVTNLDDATVHVRWAFVLDTVANYKTKVLEPQQPGPQEQAGTELDTVAEAKDYERIAALLYSIKDEVLRATGSGNPNSTSGAFFVATLASALTNLTPAGNTVQQALEAIDSKVGTINSSLGKLVKHSYTETGSLVSGSAAIPYDDTAPLSTEGFLVLSVAHVPLSASNLIVTLAAIQLGSSLGPFADTSIATLFRDSTCVAVGVGVASNVGGMTSIGLHKREAAGSTSSRTYSLRAGSASGGNTAVNGDSSGSVRRFGGVCNTSLHVLEFSP